MAPRLRPLLTPPNDGTQKENKLDLRVALKTGAGHGLLIEPVTTRIKPKTVPNDLASNLVIAQVHLEESCIQYVQIA